jgi:hypothetical protein
MLPIAATSSADADAERVNSALRAIGLFGVMTAVLITLVVIVATLVYLRWRRRRALALAPPIIPPDVNIWEESVRRLPSVREEDHEDDEPPR